MSKLPLRILLRLVPALLAMLLCAAPPAAAEPCMQGNGAIAARDGAPHGLAHLPKTADHAAKRQRASASLEEFVGVDDDAEQYLKPQAVLVRPIVVATFAADQAISSYRVALPNHPACAAPPTGPPHA